jgi:transposase
VGVHRKTVTRWANTYRDGGFDALRPKKAKGILSHIPKTSLDAVKRWTVGRLAKQGLDRSNWPHAELAGHLLKTRSRAVRYNADSRN